MGNIITKKGVDLSRWNVVTDFNAMKKDGVDFVLLRAGYGFTKDAKFDEFVTGCKKVGIPVTGVYHFSYSLTVADAQKEAALAVRWVEEAGLPKDTVIFFDYEYDSVRYANVCGCTPDKLTCITLTTAFCEAVEKMGYKAGVYYNVDFERNWYEEDLLKKYARWIADWRVGYVHPEAWIHQYSNVEKVAGIKGEVDADLLQIAEENADEEIKMESESPITLLAREVLNGDWGNGAERQRRILDAVQSEVNRLLKEMP